MNKSFLFSVFLAMACLQAPAQSQSVFPSRIPTDSDLLIANNLWETKLTAQLSAASLVIPVQSTSGLKTPTVVTINGEIIKICAVTSSAMTICQGGRGYEKTTVNNHPAGSRVQALITAGYHNQLAAEIKAVAAGLGVGFGELMRTTSGMPSGNSVPRFDASIKKYRPSQVTIDENGALYAPGGLFGTVQGSIEIATRLNSDPLDCAVGQYAVGIDAYGNLACKAVNYSELSGTPTGGGSSYTSPLTSIGDTLWRSSSGDARVPGNATTSKMFYTQSGNGATPSIPQWLPIAELDLPSSFLNTLVRTSRQITAGYGLSGGGDLSTNRSLAVVDGSTVQNINVRKNGSAVGSSTTLNLIEGSNVSLTVATNGSQIDVTIGSTVVVGGATPTGPAGGDLGGSYPNPTVAQVGGRSAASLISSLDSSAAAISEAASTNTPNVLMKRDANGDVTARYFIGQVNGNASTATALFSNPTDCSAGQFATAIDAGGNLTCAAPSITLAGDVTGATGAGVVERLRGRNVNFTVAPVEGQVLGFNVSGEIVPVNAPAPASMPYANLTSLPAPLANINNGRIRLSEVGCGNSYASGCDVNADGWPDNAGGAPWTGISSKPAQWLDSAVLAAIVVDFNSSRPSGFYEASSATNQPEAGTHNYATLEMRGTNTGAVYGRQVAYEFGTGSKIWSRPINAGTFGSWLELVQADGRTYNLTAAAAQNIATGATPSLGSVTSVTNNGSQFYGVHLDLSTTTVGNGDGPKIQFTKNITGSTKRWGIGFLQGSTENKFSILEDLNSASSYGTPRMTFYTGGDVLVPGKAFVGGYTQTNNIQAGAMSMGLTSSSFGMASGWTSNVAGLLLQTNGNQEVAVNYNGTRLNSLLAYSGSTNTTTINRDMGWGASALVLNGVASFTQSVSVAETSTTYQVRTGTYMDVSANSCGTGLLATNAYTHNNGSSCVFKYANTHASIGAVGILLNNGDEDVRFFSNNGPGTANAQFTPNVLATMSKTGEWGFSGSPSNDQLTIYKDWFDNSSTDFGGGLRIQGTAPAVSFFDTDNTGSKFAIQANNEKLSIYRRPTGGGWMEALAVDSNNNITASYSLGVGGAPIAKLSTLVAIGEMATIRMPADNNGAGTGNADLNLWVGEPSSSWTGTGLARNITNTNSTFPRANANLSGQMMRFKEDGSIDFVVETSAGSRTTPLQITPTGVAFDRQFGWTVVDATADLATGTTESVWVNRSASTFTAAEVYCESNTGTAVIQLQRDDGAPANVLGSNLTCTTGGATTSTFVNGENVLATGQKLDFVLVTSPSGTRRVNVFIKGR